MLVPGGVIREGSRGRRSSRTARAGGQRIAFATDAGEPLDQGRIDQRRVNRTFLGRWPYGGMLGGTGGRLDHDLNALTVGEFGAVDQHDLAAANDSSDPI